jgi:hypothetical protein
MANVRLWSSMLTYSGWNQPVLASYGEKNLAKLRAVQAIYDPTHVFQRLVPGGQKLPDANLASTSKNGGLGMVVQDTSSRLG